MSTLYKKGPLGQGDGGGRSYYAKMKGVKVGVRIVPGPGMDKVAMCRFMTKKDLWLSWPM